MTIAVRSALERFNDLPREDAESRLLFCCGSAEWARQLAGKRPFRSAEELANASDRIWRSLSKEDWLAAFAAHPRIGSEKVAGTGPTDLHPQQSIAGDWARREQAGTKNASPDTLAGLAEANREYEKRFGHIFIVCASGKSAEEMLAEALARLHNDPQTELEIAAEEQRKITRLRLAKLLEAEEA